MPVGKSAETAILGAAKALRYLGKKDKVPFLRIKCSDSEARSVIVIKSTTPEQSRRLENRLLS